MRGVDRSSGTLELVRQFAYNRREFLRSAGRMALGQFSDGLPGHGPLDGSCEETKSGGDHLWRRSA